MHIQKLAGYKLTWRNKVKSIDELIEYIRKARIPAKYCVDKFSKSYSGACDDILEKVQELKKNTDWVKIDYEDESTWPEDKQEVFILLDKGTHVCPGKTLSVTFCKYFDGRIFARFYSIPISGDSPIFDIQKVTHWRPLPELPKD